MMTRVIATHPPVELVDQRNDHTRVWEIVREVETTHPDVSTTVDAVKSHIHEKASGLCYKDQQGDFVPSEPHWVATPEGFTLEGCRYRLSAPKTLAGPVEYAVNGRVFLFRPAHLTASDGTANRMIADIATDVAGTIDPDDARRLLFPGAFGDVGELEIVAKKGEFHQNVVLRKKPTLPPGLSAADARVFLYTEIGLDEFLAQGPTEVRIGAEITDMNALDLSTPPSKTAPIAFYGSGSDEGAGLLHCFARSPVYDSSSDRPAGIVGELAERRLLRGPQTGLAYLVESIAFRFFEEARYPVVWDYVNFCGQYQGGDAWDPRYTYRITGNLYVSGTLTILPGTTVKLDPYVSIYINAGGKIVAKGEPYSYITFTRTRNNECGEPISVPPDLPFMTAIDLAAGSSADSVIQYCKIGNGICGISTCQSLNNPITNNIVRDMSFVGTVVQFNADVSCRNNLVADCAYYGVYYYQGSADEITNNTVDDCNSGMSLVYTSCPRVTDNLLTNCTNVGIGALNSTLSLHHNGYWRCTTPVSGTDMGTDNVLLGESNDPYEQCGIGNFFLNTNENAGALLRDAGSRSAGDAGMENLWRGVNAPRGDIPEEITRTDTEWRSWERGLSDVGDVDIGYHHSRVDYLVTHDVTATGLNELNTCTLGFSMGVVVAFDPVYETVPIELVAGQYGGISSGGRRVSGSFPRFTSDKACSMNMESPRWCAAPLRGRVRLTSESNPYSRFEDTWVSWSVGLEIDLTLNSTLTGNVFQYSSRGVRCAAPNSFSNSLFVANGDGLSAWDAVQGGLLDGELTVTNCTFADNERGIRVGTAQGGESQLTAKDCIFTHDPTSASPTTAISVQDWDCTLDENHSAFHKPGGDENDHVWYVDHYIPINTQAGSMNLTQPPYDTTTEYCRRFLLSQTCPAVDAGSCSAEEARMNVETTSGLGSLDDATVDMGYHYRVLPPTTPPGPSNVLVVWNANGTDEGDESEEIKDYYCSARNILGGNVLGINLPPASYYAHPWDAAEKKNIDAEDYYQRIRDVIAGWFAAPENQGKDIRFIVLCKGLPYRVEFGVPKWPYYSITGRLTCWEYDTNANRLSCSSDDYTDINVFTGAAVNKRFGRNVYSLKCSDGKRVPISCLVTMLNGYSVDDVKKMIDKSVGFREPRDSVYWIIDNRNDAAMLGSGESNFREVGIKTEGPDKRLFVDYEYEHLMSSDISDGPLMGYSNYSSGYFQWGEDEFYPWRRITIDFRAANGCIETVAESHDGRGFMDGTITWGQGLTADGFHPEANQGSDYSRSLSGGCCHSQEPTVFGVAYPDVLYPRYYQGYTFAEAAFMAQRVLGAAKVLHVGDPLMTVE